MIFPSAFSLSNLMVDAVETSTVPVISSVFPFYSSSAASSSFSKDLDSADAEILMGKEDELDSEESEPHPTRLTKTTNDKIRLNHLYRFILFPPKIHIDL